MHPGMSEIYHTLSSSETQHLIRAGNSSLKASVVESDNLLAASTEIFTKSLVTMGFAGLQRSEEGSISDVVPVAAE